MNCSPLSLLIIIIIIISSHFPVYLFPPSISIIFKYFFVNIFFLEKKRHFTTREQQHVRDEMSTSVALVSSYASKQEPFKWYNRSEEVHFFGQFGHSYSSILFLASFFFIVSLPFFHF